MTIPVGTSGGGAPPRTAPSSSGFAPSAVWVTGSPSSYVLPGSSYGPQIAAAAERYHVPYWVLVGIFGMETDFGHNVNTSSAGAVGLMQFIPSTAAGYGYPLTNTPNAQQSQQQFNAAAQYLSNLYNQTGSWDSAITSYSGGGYTLSDVRSKAAGELTLKQGITPTSPIAQGIGDIGSLSLSTPDILSSIWTALTNPSHWLRALEVLGGVMALYFGIKALTGSDGPSINITTAAKTAAKVAEA